MPVIVLWMRALWSRLLTSRKGLESGTTGMRAPVDPPNDPTERLPAPSAEIVLIRVALSAYLSTVSKKRGDALLRTMAELLTSEETLSQLLPIRPAADHVAVSRARRGALAIFRALLPTWLAVVRGK